MRTTQRILTSAALAVCIGQAAQPVQAASALEPSLQFIAGVLGAPNFTPSPAYTINDDVWVTASDGTRLAANVLVPTAGTGPFPVIVFINSWALNEYEYIPEAQKLAKAGYVVLSYSTRGFGASEGLIGTASPQDIDDYKRMIDWVLANTPADPARIGTAGISYGSGISLIGAAQDPRVKAVAALSTWGSLVESLYGKQTPRLIWGELLNVSSQLLGRPDPLIKDYWSRIKSQGATGDVSEVVSWAQVRSPINYVEGLNTNGTAVFISKNWGDDLFHPNTVLDLFADLTGPKQIYLAPGTHATNEIFGMMGIGPNTIFDETRRWFDYHLKGEDNGIMDEKPVRMEVKLSQRVDGFDAWPLPETDEVTFYLHPREFLSGGELEPTPFQSWWSQSNRIDSLFDTVASSGIPLASQLLEQGDVPTLSSIPLIAYNQGIWFETGRLSAPMEIRGEPTLQVQVEPKSTTLQMFGYLYDVDALGIGKLITHAPITLPSCVPGQARTLDLEFVTTAYDVPAGHRLVLALDTQDLLYQKPEGFYKVDFKFASSRQSVLKVPTL